MTLFGFHQKHTELMGTSVAFDKSYCGSSVHRETINFKGWHLICKFGITEIQFLNICWNSDQVLYM